MIKVVATDMDGTFLNSHNDYNREQFKAVFEKMRKKGVKLVIISGNQYYQIKSFFKGLEDQITFVGENGAYFVENDQFIRSVRLDNELVRKVLDYLKNEKLDDELVLCGEESAYILKKASQEAKDDFAIYYYRLKEVDSFDILPDDHFMKFSFNTPIEKTMGICEQLNIILGDKVRAVSSGHGNIDIIAKGINKGSALEYLLERWDISPDDLAGFGDGGNDVELLRLAKYSYAMANGSEQAKAAARYIAPSNDDSGVLQTVERLLEEE